MDLEFPRGDTKKFKFKLKDKNGEDISLTPGDMLYFTVKQDPNTNARVIHKKLGSGIELGDDGYYHVTLTSNDTAELAYGGYGYDIELKSSTGLVQTLTIGNIVLTEEYTWKGDEN
jgi:hypothetical protein